MRSSFLFRSLIVFLPVFFQISCAHTPSYTPEIWGVGAMHGKGDGIIYSIPPKDPDLKMKIISGGIQSDRLLSLRIYFFRTKNASAEPEYLDPKELSVKYGPKEPEVFPAKIKANQEHKPMLQLTAEKRQEIELAFPIPADVDPKVGVESFVFYWKVHYGKNLTDAQAAAFDRKDKAARNAPGPDDFPETDTDPYWGDDNLIWW